MTDDIIISGKGITKKFGDFTALDNIDVSVRRGEIYGFLGPNGAGKTTTIRVMTSLTPATSGTIKIEGEEVKGLDDPKKEKIGIIQQHIALDRDVSVAENIWYHAILHHIPKKVAKERIDRLVKIMGLEPYMNHMTINLSGGWKRRTAIVAALIHEPAILVLDEPTAGLDTQSRHMLWQLIRELNSAGTTVFLTTHYMDEAQELCDRIAILNHGKIIAEGTPEELCENLGRWAVEYIEDGIKKYRYFSDIEDSKSFRSTLGDEVQVTTRPTNLEDVFLELTGRENTNATEEVSYRV
ncbi:MAG: ABC transporter ATP-binding protein [Thermoplasmata archaeon]|jgi:ABC-2 type transport system ATP-binding protein|nr:ABC transporter ATP-binding protein [Thermoplasmata archaeon]